MTNILAQDIENASPYAIIQKAALDYAELNRLKLFAIDPATRQGSLYSGHSDRARWEAAFAAGMHLGVSAINSDGLLFDVDVYGPEDRDEAWQHYLALCEELKIAVLPPYAHSKSGGWHFAFRAPSWFKEGLRKGHHKFKISHFRPLKPGEVDKERISVRWRALNVYPGSVSNGGVHQLTVDKPPPHPYGPTTANLFEWYATLKVEQKNPTTAPSTDACLQSDAECVKLERFVRELMLKDPAWFEDRDNRLATIWGIKRAGFGCRGYETAEIICDVTPDGKGDRLNRYWNDSGANRGTKTLASFWKHCADMGIRQVPQEIAEWRKDRVTVSFNEQAAEIAGTPLAPATANTMLAGTQAIVYIGTPLVTAFNATHATIAHDIGADTLLPHDMHAAPLLPLLNEAIGKILTLAETQRHALRFETIGTMLGVLHSAHQITYDIVVARVRATGARLPDGRLKIGIRSFEADVERALRTGQGWVLNTSRNNTNPNPNISDNVDVLLTILKADLKFNDFTQRIEFSRNNEPWCDLKTKDLHTIHGEANSAEHRFHVSERFLETCMSTIAGRRTYDPLIDYLNGLSWDNVQRLDAWISRACGAPIDAYHAAVARNVIGGMVKRARNPAAKHDEMLLLISKRQGTNKSGMAKALMPDPKWFGDGLDLTQSKQNLIPDISGKWVIEWAELDGMAKKEIQAVKAFLSRDTDRMAAKFEKLADDYRRRFIMIATSNDETPLRDESGGRRFLPVNVRGEIDIAWIEANRDQLFAEADALFQAGERFGIPRELWDVAGEHQEAARRTSHAEDLAAEWFGDREGLYYVTATDMTKALQRCGVPPNAPIENALSRVGLSRVLIRGGKRRRVWISEGADPKTAPRVTLAEMRPDQDRSKVLWQQWPVAEPAKPVTPVRPDPPLGPPPGYPN